jgi:hypothetical protein
LSAKNHTTLVVLQPGYLPWLGFFDQVYRSDIFVFYDDVQFDKNGWRNRNRIKSPAGPHWLTVPVRVNSLEQRIFETEIDDRQPWARKHLGTIRQFYARAPYLKRYLPELEDVLTGRRWQLLIDLDVAVIELMCRWLGIERRMLRSSELGATGERSERLLNICLSQGASRYLSGSAARAYLDTELFLSHGIEVSWQDYQHPVYTQQHGEFIPFLSALDLLLNCGEDESAAIIAGKIR